MAFTGWQGPFTGDGSFQLAGGAGVVPNAIDCALDAITNPQIRKLGTGDNPRLLYAGSFGFSYVEDDPLSVSHEFIVYQIPISFAFMDYTMAEFNITSNQATNLFYRLRPGASFYLAAWYA